MLETQGYRFAPEAEKAFWEYLERRMRLPNFAYARSVRNALDRFKLRQAYRLYQKAGPVTPEELMTIAADDIYQSLVFRDKEGEDAP